MFETFSLYPYYGDIEREMSALYNYNLLFIDSACLGIHAYPWGTATDRNSVKQIIFIYNS